MLPFRSGRSLKAGATAAFFALLLGAFSAIAATPKPKGKKSESKATPPPGPKGAPSPIGGIPLPIGQEIKGLVLPDFDVDGRLRSRFDAGTAKRLDAERIEFKGLKVTSFTPENTIDLQIELPVSTFDVTSRVLRSSERTTVRRSDFTISGDVMEFNTIDRKGTLTGNVKMVINDRSAVEGKQPK